MQVQSFCKVQKQCLLHVSLGFLGDAGRVQMSLIAEAVMWKRGILVMPPIVNKLVKAMQVGPIILRLLLSTPVYCLSLTCIKPVSCLSTTFYC